MEFFAKVEYYYREKVRAKCHDKLGIKCAIHSADESAMIDTKMRRVQDWKDYENLTRNSKGVTYEQESTKKIRQRILRDSQKVDILQ